MPLASDLISGLLQACVLHMNLSLHIWQILILNKFIYRDELEQERIELQNDISFLQVS